MFPRSDTHEWRLPGYYGSLVSMSWHTRESLLLFSLLPILDIERFLRLTTMGLGKRRANPRFLPRFFNLPRGILEVSFFNDR